MHIFLEFDKGPVRFYEMNASILHAVIAEPIPTLNYYLYTCRGHPLHLLTIWRSTTNEMRCTITAVGSITPRHTIRIHYCAMYDQYGQLKIEFHTPPFPRYYDAYCQPANPRQSTDVRSSTSSTPTTTTKKWAAMLGSQPIKFHPGRTEVVGQMAEVVDNNKSNTDRNTPSNLQLLVEAALGDETRSKH